MSESKHTPGEWIVLFEGTTVPTFPIQIRSKNRGQRYIIAHVFHPLYESELHLEESEANANLIAAAPDLLNCQTMGAELNTPDFLDWIADRLVKVHGENPNVDYVLSLRERAKAGRAAISKAKGEQA